MKHPTSFSGIDKDTIQAYNNDTQINTSGHSNRRRCRVKAIMRIIIVATISIIVLFTVASCSPSISQEEYDSLKSELSDTKNQLTNLQNKLAEATVVETQFDNLNTQYEELKKQHDAQIDEIQTIKFELDELNTEYEQLKTQDDARINEIQAIQAEYDDLKQQYDILAQGTAMPSEEEVEQAIFELINQERIDNNVDELAWGINLYNRAEDNSREMAEEGEFQYTGGAVSGQEVFITARHGTLEQIADATLMFWKNDDLKYSYNVLDPQSIYGAVCTYKLGEVYYITYISSVYK